MTGRKSVAMAVAMAMVAAILCGCLGETEQGFTWIKPAQVRVENVAIDAVGQKAYVTVKMYDAQDQVTQWDVQLRLIAVDSKDFTMLNKTFNIKAKDFKSTTSNNVIDTQYDMAVPFADFARSKDRVAGLFTGKQMTIYAWIEYGGVTFKQSPTHLIMNTVEIPAGLLVPNEAPKADLVGYTTGFVGQSLTYNASGSSDDTGFKNLSFKWAWGDGRTTVFLAKAVESHTYNAAGTYTLNMTVTDPEGANDTKSLTVAIADPLVVTVGTIGINTTPGAHFNDTYVEFTMENVATYDIDISALDPMLLNATGVPQDNNGTETPPPGELTPGQSVTVVAYFVLPLGFSPTEIEVLGEPYTIP